MTEQTKAYRVTRSGLMKNPRGDYCKAGDVLQLLERQAKAFSDRVELVAEGLKVQSQSPEPEEKLKAGDDRKGDSKRTSSDH